MSLNIQQWDYERCKGMISSFVTRDEGISERIAKSIRTIIERNHLIRAEVDQMLIEIRRDTVQPFLRTAWNQPERLVRFREIESALYRTLQQ